MHCIAIRKAKAKTEMMDKNWEKLIQNMFANSFIC